MENDWTHELDRLRAENARLREAIKGILPVLMADAGNMPVSAYVIALNQKIARLRALAGEEGGKDK